MLLQKFIYFRIPHFESNYLIHEAVDYPQMDDTLDHP